MTDCNAIGTWVCNILLSPEVYSIYFRLHKEIVTFFLQKLDIGNSLRQRKEYINLKHLSYNSMLRKCTKNEHNK